MTKWNALRGNGAGGCSRRGAEAQRDDGCFWGDYGTTEICGNGIPAVGLVSLPNGRDAVATYFRSPPSQKKSKRKKLQRF